MSAPIARARFSPSWYGPSTSVFWMTGVMPSIAMVNIDSRPQVVVTPRKSVAIPCSLTMRVGVERVEPPNLCCWIMTSSHMLQGMPDASPPRKAPPTWAVFAPCERKV